MSEDGNDRILYLSIKIDISRNPVGKQRVDEK